MGGYGMYDGELINRCHKSHNIDGHELRFYLNPPEKYICNDCQMPGDKNPCLKCPYENCEFSIHQICYKIKPGSVHSPEFFNCLFTFHHSPDSDRGDVYCDACGVDISGYSYRCDSPDNQHDLHPTCAHLGSTMTTENGVVLELREKENSKCLHCRKRYPVEECIRFTGWKWVAKKRDWGFPFCFMGRKICYHLKCMNEIKALR